MNQTYKILEQVNFSAPVQVSYSPEEVEKHLKSGEFKRVEDYLTSKSSDYDRKELADLPVQEVHPLEIAGGDIVIDEEGRTKTISKQDAQKGLTTYFVRRSNGKQFIPRVLFRKWYKGEITGYHTQI